MLAKMTTGITTSTAIKKKKKPYRLHSPSLGLAVTIVIIISAMTRLHTLALSTVASAFMGPPNRSSISAPDERSYGDPDEFVLRR